MTKLERAVGFMILTAFIITLDVAVFDHVSERLSVVIGELAKAVAQSN